MWTIGYFNLCIDHLRSVVILRGGVILYYTTGKFTKPELHQRQKPTVEKKSKTSPSCSLKSTMKQPKIKIKI